jgi:L-seryl-tRNA(Ser) seleniumtransferase
MARIVRVGKLTLAALEATLLVFFDRERALAEVPTLRMVCRPLEDIAAAARRIAEAIRRAVPAAAVAVVDGVSQMGGGSLPGQDLPTRLVAVGSAGVGPDELAQRLRGGSPSVFARISADRVLLDPRTVLDGEEEPLAAAVVAALDV